jgi:hypothetical protein
MPWFDYRPTRGRPMPVLNIVLQLADDQSYPIDFIVDSGAAICAVPRVRVQYMLMRLPQLPDEQDTGLVDANGNAVRGAPIDFDVRVRGADLPSVRERIWVTPTGDWGLLGQTWFERFVVHFHNFANTQKGRRFYVHPFAMP